MVVTWTFYPKYGERVSLEVTYLPKLDKPGTWGFLHVDANKAWVCWDCFKAFDRGDLQAKKDAFTRLARLEPEKYIVPDGRQDLYLVIDGSVELKVGFDFLPPSATFIKFSRPDTSIKAWNFDSVLDQNTIAPTA